LEERTLIIWSLSARQMLSEIYKYIYQHNQSAAGNYIDGVYASVKKLERHPEFAPLVEMKY